MSTIKGFCSLFLPQHYKKPPENHYVIPNNNNDGSNKNISIDNLYEANNILINMLNCYNNFIYIYHHDYKKININNIYDNFMEYGDILFVKEEHFFLPKQEISTSQMDTLIHLRTNIKNTENFIQYFLEYIIVQYYNHKNKNSLLYKFYKNFYDISWSKDMNIPGCSLISSDVVNLYQRIMQKMNILRNHEEFHSLGEEEFFKRCGEIQEYDFSQESPLNEIDYPIQYKYKHIHHKDSQDFFGNFYNSRIFSLGAYCKKGIQFFLVCFAIIPPYSPKEIG